MLENDE